MASTRSFQQVQSLQDPLSSQNTFAAMSKPRPQLQPSAMPLQPMSNLSQQPEVVIDPPLSAPQQQSPLKSFSQLSPPMPSYANLTYISIPPPQQYVFTDSPTKKIPQQASRPYSQPMTQQPLFTTFNSNADAFEPGDFQPPNSHLNNYADFPEPSYARKQTLKRSYSDVVPMQERPFKKQMSDDELIKRLPDPEDMPPIEDDGGKPTFSYAQMIGMAILRAPNRRLTLAQIYEWISNTFTFYRESKQGWHNSIRHNLSLNKAFSKQERPKGDAGKGSYWIIEPGSELAFVKEKPRKANGAANITLHPQVMRQDLSTIAQPLADALTPNTWLAPPKTSARPQTAPPLPELSSDATLPASDPALDEEHGDTNAGLQNPPQSSPPQAINSSPPIATGTHRRSDSSPVGQQGRPSSSYSRKQRSTAMDDSGYFSSLESSALRPGKSGIVLTSEIDLPRKNRGRAEEEIVRIRSSSHDITPSHRRFRSLGSDDVLDSSPIASDALTRLNPTTPSFIFKKPLLPPASISPNTQLRNHRLAMQEYTKSPLKTLGGLCGHDLDTYSPAFKWPGNSAYDDRFEVFSDTGTTPATPAFGSSPLKRSARGPSLVRATTSANILSDITSATGRLNAKTPSKGPVLQPSSRPGSVGSPLKKLSNNNPTVAEEQEELFDFGLFADENSDDGEGVDILKGFQKIGGAVAKPHASPSKISKTSRPGLGSRSLTSQF